jgi:arsenate reductase-like glutaredoxin family protein
LSKGLSVSQLDSLIGKDDYRRFLNSRNDLYRERNMKDHPPSREEALRLMSENPNLVRRPLLVKGGKVVAGFDSEAMKELLGAKS